MELPIVSEYFVFPFLLVECRTYTTGLLMIDKGEDPDNSVRVKILSKVWLYVKKSVTLYAES